MAIVRLMPKSEKKPVYEDSFETLMERGVEFAGNENGIAEVEGEQQKTAILTNLTRTQQEVATLLAQGFKRKEVAAQRSTTLRAVHQIVLRIRVRVKKKLGGKYAK